MSCNHFRESGDRKNSSLRIAIGMPYSRKKLRGGTTIA